MKDNGAAVAFQDRLHCGIIKASLKSNGVFFGISIEPSNISNIPLFSIVKCCHTVYSAKNHVHSAIKIKTQKRVCHADEGEKVQK